MKPRLSGHIDLTLITFEPSVIETKAKKSRIQRQSGGREDCSPPDKSLDGGCDSWSRGYHDVFSKIDEFSACSRDPAVQTDD